MRVRRTPLVLLESATVLSGTGNGVAAVVLPWLILDRTGSAVATGVVAAATFLPLLGSSLVAGTVVDRVGRRRSAVVSDALSAASVAAIPVLDWFGGLTLTTLALLAIGGAVFDPAGFTAREAMVPSVARAARWPLERANGVHEAVWGLAFLVGPGMGGLLIALVGPVGALWATAVGFAASAALVAFVRVDGAGRPARLERPIGLWSGTAEGIAFVWRDRLLRTLWLLSAVILAVYLPIEGVILPVYFEARQEPARLGLLITAMSGGGVLGALAYGAWGGRLRRRPIFITAIVGTAAGVVLMALLPPYPLMLALGVVVGVLYGPVNPLVNLAMQARSDERLRGRVVGLITSSTYAAGPLGFLLAGPLVQWLGVGGAFITFAALLLAGTLLAIPASSLRALDTLEVP